MSNTVKIILTAAVLLICIGLVVVGTVTENGSITDHIPRIIIMVLGAVLIIVRILSQKNENRPYRPDILRKAIDEAHEEILKELEEKGYLSDHSLESLRDTDRFLDDVKNDIAKKPNRMTRSIFTAGVYTGETIIAEYGGEWVVSDCKNEMYLELKLNDGSTVMPVLTAFKRYASPDEASLYDFAYCIVNDNSSKNNSNNT